MVLYHVLLGMLSKGGRNSSGGQLGLPWQLGVALATWGVGGSLWCGVQGTMIRSGNGYLLGADKRYLKIVFSSNVGEAKCVCVCVCVCLPQR